ncbi:serum response factor-binding protein 1-like [Planococcus citri]|uniref:serum response factor-binding protein 1-like n=1 Tax=Planococcus citri TaxID=170843 RepID=UPI0031F837FF
MESLNKLILNNKIVDMRHSVRQSRIQAINKLVKEIKKLRDKKGTDEQKAKNASKADRYVECIQIMKKIKEDDVSKFALMNEKSLAQITNNVNETPEIKAIARISDHRPVHSKVKAFRETYPDWKETLPLLFDSLGDRYQEKKKKKLTTKNKTKSIDNKSKSTSENPKKTAKVTYIENKLGTWRVEEIVPSKEKTNNSNKFDRDNFNEKKDHVTNNPCNDGIELPQKKEKIKKDKSLGKVKNSDADKVSRKEFVEDETVIKLSKENENPIIEEKITRTVDPFFVTKDNIKKDKSHSKVKNSEAGEVSQKKFVEDETVIKLSKENENPIIEEKITRTVDPFFVTKDNKEYLSVSIANNTSNIEEKKPDFPSKKFKNDFSESKTREKNNRKRSRVDVPEKYSKIETKEETLHPSWEAKRKQSSITKFQGKKITFDD